MNDFNPAPDDRKAIIASERAWHEQEAKRRFSLDAFLYDPPAFDQVVQTSLAYLRLEPDEAVLDLGCGEGKETLQLASHAWLVVSIDLSYQQLCRARQRIQEFAPQASVCFVQANAEELPFASGAFRKIYGKAILHHLDITLAARETKRVLSLSGRAAFAEPMAHHPLFWLARKLTPKLRTRDEHPLTGRDLRQFGACFGRSEIEAHFLLTPLSYVLRLLPGGEPVFRRLHSILQRIDTRLCDVSARLSHLAWYGVVKVEK